MTDETRVDEAKTEARRFRLTTRAVIAGAVREPGFVFSLAEGELGPHRTVVASNHGAQIVDHIEQQQRLEDVPLYEPFEEPQEKLPAEESEPLSQAHAADRARIADLERELADKDKQLGEAHARLMLVDNALGLAVDKLPGHEEEKDLAVDEIPGRPLLLDTPQNNLPQH
jgi:hypothetical protein